MKKKQILFGVIIAQIVIVYLSVHYAAHIKYLLRSDYLAGILPGVTLTYLKLAKWFIIFPVLSIGLTVVSLTKGDIERQYDKIIILS